MQRFSEGLGVGADFPVLFFIRIMCRHVLTLARASSSAPLSSQGITPPHTSPSRSSRSCSSSSCPYASSSWEGVSLTAVRRLFPELDTHEEEFGVWGVERLSRQVAGFYHVDSLQQIHAAFNLATLLESHLRDILPFLLEQATSSASSESSSLERCCETQEKEISSDASAQDVCPSPPSAVSSPFVGSRRSHASSVLDKSNGPMQTEVQEREAKEAALKESEEKETGRQGETKETGRVGETKTPEKSLVEEYRKYAAAVEDELRRARSVYETLSCRYTRKFTAELDKARETFLKRKRVVAAHQQRRLRLLVGEEKCQDAKAEGEDGEGSTTEGKKTVKNPETAKHSETVKNPETAKHSETVKNPETAKHSETEETQTWNESGVAQWYVVCMSLGEELGKELVNRVSDALVESRGGLRSAGALRFPTFSTAAGLVASLQLQMRQLYAAREDLLQAVASVDHGDQPSADLLAAFASCTNCNSLSRAFSASALHRGSQNAFLFAGEGADETSRRGEERKSRTAESGGREERDGRPLQNGVSAEAKKRGKQTGRERHSSRGRCRHCQLMPQIAALQFFLYSRVEKDVGGIGDEKGLDEGGFHHFGESELLTVMRVVRAVLRRSLSESIPAHRRLVYAAEEHMKELEAIKKESMAADAYFFASRQVLSALDELHISTSRFRLKSREEELAELALRRLSAGRKKGPFSAVASPSPLGPGTSVSPPSFDALAISRADADTMRQSLLLELGVTAGDLEKAHRQHRYLSNLRDEEEKKNVNDPCEEEEEAVSAHNADAEANAASLGEKEQGAGRVEREEGRTRTREGEEARDVQKESKSKSEEGEQPHEEERKVALAKDESGVRELCEVERQREEGRGASERCASGDQGSCDKSRDREEGSESGDKVDGDVCQPSEATEVAWQHASSHSRKTRERERPEGREEESEEEREKKRPRTEEDGSAGTSPIMPIRERQGEEEPAEDSREAKKEKRREQEKFSPTLCPVCFVELEKNTCKAVLPCAHQMCVECTRALRTEKVGMEKAGALPSPHASPLLHRSHLSGNFPRSVAPFSFSPFSGSNRSASVRHLRRCPVCRHPFTPSQVAYISSVSHFSARRDFSLSTPSKKRGETERKETSGLARGSPPSDKSRGDKEWQGSEGEEGDRERRGGDKAETETGSVMSGGQRVKSTEAEEGVERDEKSEGREMEDRGEEDDVGCQTPTVSASLRARLRRRYSAKFAAVIERVLTLLRDASSSSSSTPQASPSPSKILIFSEWPAALDLLQVALRRSGVVSLKYLGGHSQADRTTLWYFRNDPHARVLLCSLLRAGRGLTLTEATHVVFLEVPLNHAEEEQAIGRVYRMAQKRQTHVWRFIVKDSVEERIVQMRQKPRDGLSERLATAAAVKEDGDVREEGEEREDAQDASTMDSASNTLLRLGQRLTARDVAVLLGVSDPSSSSPSSSSFASSSSSSSSDVTVAASGESLRGKEGKVETSFFPGRVDAEERRAGADAASQSSRCLTPSEAAGQTAVR
ncbi:SNF2 family N-terminal domain-containing protein [Toxoplasma gondii FOU]|uniref:SNF2 family N-terminal domain-containing protein n=2 Tax=Toxoplasma gondii TaxID=5811 RepID=A0A086LGP2_TOXGO|nr:SNF2 family N-terminal domain-containing protein [Toxoplasma gondii FOU]PUA91908.1 SNF2 family N-terminal domain-containing protein [Toxoplasma gondii TgCATBr9]